jgi:hypothetical protein
MAVCRSLLVLGVGAAIGGAVLLAYRVSQDSGKSIMEAWPDVPGEAGRLVTDLRGRAEEAMQRGREAYEVKQAEIAEHLQGAAQAD